MIDICHECFKRSKQLLRLSQDLDLVNLYSIPIIGIVFVLKYVRSIRETKLSLYFKLKSNCEWC